MSQLFTCCGLFKLDRFTPLPLTQITCLSYGTRRQLVPELKDSISTTNSMLK